MTGFVGGEEEAFENQSMAWQTATIYFAVIELVAAVGLWLATPWGAVVWLTTVVSMAVIELMFPGIYGGSLTVVGARSRDACGLSGACLDGRARTAAIAAFRTALSACVRKFAMQPAIRFFENFRGNFSAHRKGFPHTRYAVVSNSTKLFWNATARADEA